MFYININFENLIVLLKMSKELKGSEYLSRLRQNILDELYIKYPILFELLNS